MSKVMNLLTGKGNHSKNTIPTSQPSGFYQTLFRKLLAALPVEIKTNKTLYPQVKMIGLAVNNMTEDTAQQLAMHIKGLAQAINDYEQQNEASHNQANNSETN